MTFLELTGSTENESDSQSRSYNADIIAVHGLHERGLETWTERISGINWLRELLPRHVKGSRSLVYDYSIENLLEPNDDFGRKVILFATTLVQELTASRADRGADERPIVFICHGFGGLLVKQALILSASNRSGPTEHLRQIYVSTFAILFLGTPHQGFSKAFLSLRHPFPFPVSHDCLHELSGGSALLTELDQHFTPLLQRFAIHDFWEEQKTIIGRHETIVVDNHSARLRADNAECCGIQATHSGMVKFRTSRDHGFNVVVAALKRYVRNSVGRIEARWGEEYAQRDLDRRRQASELLDSSSPTVVYRRPSSSSVSAPEIYQNEYFFGLRRPDPRFIGRTIHANLVQNLFGPIVSRPVECQPKVVVVCGLGGAGKTQFARKFAYDSRSKYWGVFWIDASSDSALETGFQLLALEVGKGGGAFSGIHWLERCTKPWLLIMDNADDPNLQLLKYIPFSGNGHIMITTRNPSLAEQVNIGEEGVIKLGIMDPEEGVTLLLRSAYPREDTYQQSPENITLARQLASQLGYLAIALAYAGASIRTRYHTLESYLRRYVDHRKAITRRPRACRTGEINIIATWEVPFQKILTDPKSDSVDAADLVHILAFFHFENVPERLFKRSWYGFPMSHLSKNKPPSFITSSESITALDDYKDRISAAFDLLYHYSIVDRDPRREMSSLHPVVHSWAQDRLTEPEQKRWLTCAVAILAHSISPYLEASGMDERRELLPHINACFKQLPQRFPTFPETTEQASQVARLASVYAENGMWELAKVWQRIVVKTRERILPRGHQDTTDAMRALGQTLWNLFKIKEAIEIQTKIAALRRWKRPALKYWLRWPPWSPNHVQYCLALDDLTLTLWLAGERHWSKYVGERAVNGLIKRLGPDDPLTLNAMFNLARTYLHLGEQQLSHRMLLKVLVKRKRFYGMDHPDTLMVRNELGMNLCAQKKHLVVAQRLVSNVLAARKRVLGEEHAYTLWSVNDLSKILCERKLGGEAVEMLNQIIPVVRRTLGEEHVGMTMTRSNLARAYVLCKRWPDAERELKDLLDNIPADHPDRVNCLSGLVHVKIGMGRLKDAEDDCEKLLAFIQTQKLFQQDKLRIQTIYQQLLEIYHLQGREKDVEILKMRMPSLEVPETQQRYQMLPIRKIQRSESELDRLDAAQQAEVEHWKKDT